MYSGRWGAWLVIHGAWVACGPMGAGTELREDVATEDAPWLEGTDAPDVAAAPDARPRDAAATTRDVVVSDDAARDAAATLDAARDSGTGACAAPYPTPCGAGRCVDTQANPFHCGACGVECPGAIPCVGGRCQCPPGTAFCNGLCVDTIRNVAHCGGCAPCPAHATCSDSRCTCIASEPTACGATCTDTTIDPRNCGTCGHACPASTPRCALGRCGS